jgi:hypothetical protein
MKNFIWDYIVVKEIGQIYTQNKSGGAKRRHFYVGFYVLFPSQSRNSGVQKTI